MPTPSRKEDVAFSPSPAQHQAEAGTATMAARHTAMPSPAHAPQRRLMHSFEHGEPDLAGAPRHSGFVRLTLLIGGPALLWSGCFFLARAFLT